MSTTDTWRPWREGLSRLLLAGYFLGMPLAVINLVLFATPVPAPAAVTPLGHVFETVELSVTACSQAGPRVPGAGCGDTAPALDAPLWLHRALDDRIV